MKVCTHLHTDYPNQIQESRSEAGPKTAKGGERLEMNQRSWVTFTSLTEQQCWPTAAVSHLVFV